ncbi:hypothetical protein [Amycolatopsis sp. NPDC098790]|uniref:hypothetical protein n=1 Tax=Amycolatopsis sp. NPDC098790 TaxID=3363939 RepID=UPI0038065DA1
MRDDGARSVGVARAVVMTSGLVLIALGVVASGALLLFFALAHGGRDWAGSEATFTMFIGGAGWTLLAGGLAVCVSRRTRGRTTWLAGLSCIALGSIPAAIVAVDLLFLLPH